MNGKAYVSIKDMQAAHDYFSKLMIFAYILKWKENQTLAGFTFFNVNLPIAQFGQYLNEF